MNAQYQDLFDRMSNAWHVTVRPTEATAIPQIHNKLPNCVDVISRHHNRQPDNTEVGRYAGTTEDETSFQDKAQFCS